MSLEPADSSWHLIDDIPTTDRFNLVQKLIVIFLISATPIFYVVWLHSKTEEQLSKLTADFFSFLLNSINISTELTFVKSFIQLALPFWNTDSLCFSVIHWLSSRMIGLKWRFGHFACTIDYRFSACIWLNKRHNKQWMLVHCSKVLFLSMSSKFRYTLPVESE